MNGKLTIQDKRWRAESDARAYITVQAVEGDKTRKSLAIKEIKRIALEKKKEADAAMKAVKPANRPTKPRKTRSRKK